MSSKLSYSSLSREFTFRVSVEDLARRDQALLVRQILEQTGVLVQILATPHGAEVFDRMFNLLWGDKQ